MTTPKKTSLGWTPTAGTPWHAPTPAPAAQQAQVHQGAPVQPGHGQQRVAYAPTMMVQTGYGQPAPQPARPTPQPGHAQPARMARPSPQPDYARAAYARTAQAQPGYGQAQMPPQMPPQAQPAYMQAQPSPLSQPGYAQALPAQPAVRPTPQPGYAHLPPRPRSRYTPPQYRHSPAADPAFVQQARHAQAQAASGHAQGLAHSPAPPPQYPQQAYSQQGYPQPAYQQQQACSAQAPGQYPQPAQGQGQYPLPAQGQGQYPQPAQGPYPQQGQPSPHQQPSPQPPQPDFNQRALAAMQSLRHRRAASSERPIPHADATMGASQRVRFIRLTYLHLLGAILAFAGLLWLLMTNQTLIRHVSLPFVNFAFGGRWNWSIVLAAFMAVSWLADYWASHARSRGMQYVGLGIYVVAEALIFVPLLAIVAVKTAAIIAKGGGDPNILRDSALVTLALFGALTASVFLSKKDFSFLRGALALGASAALMLIVLSLVFGFNLGIVFSIAMVALAAGYILYQTSQVLAHYNPEQYVAASLALFSSVALMFWYIIRIFMRARD